MHPEICRIGPFTIYSYGAMLAVAFLAGSYLARKEAGRQNIDPGIIFNLCFIVFASGIIGARLFYIFQNLIFYIKNPLEIIMLSHGGLSWIGGLIMGVVSGTLYAKIKKLPILKLLDLMAPFIALGQAIGRVGCLLNGCCFGKEADFGIRFHAHNAALIPTQVYSALILLFIFVVLRFMQDAPAKRGEIFSTYLLLYSLKRFFIEFWRGDTIIAFWGLTLFQITSALIFCIACAGLILIKKRASKT